MKISEKHFEPKNASELRRVPVGAHYVRFRHFPPTPALLRGFVNHPQVLGVIVSRDHASTVTHDLEHELKRSGLLIHVDQSRHLHLIDQVIDEARHGGQEEAHALSKAIAVFQDRASEPEYEMMALVLKLFKKTPHDLSDNEKSRRLTSALDLLSKLNLKKVFDRSLVEGREGNVSSMAFSITHQKLEMDTSPYAHGDFLLSPKHFDKTVLNTPFEYRVDPKLGPHLTLFPLVGEEHEFLPHDKRSVEQRQSIQLKKLERELACVLAAATGFNLAQSVKQGGKRVEKKIPVPKHHLVKQYGRD